MKFNRTFPVLMIAGSLILAACSTGQYTDGKYNGSGFGERGVILMEVSVVNGYVSSLVIKESYDDRTAVQESYRLLRDELIREQSAAALTVSPDYPATSKAQIEAIRDALSRAKE